MTLAAEYPVRLICRVTGWPRSGVYRRPAPAADEGRLRRALGRLAAHWPTYGYRRLTIMLRRERWSVNGQRVRRLMAAMGLRGKAPARSRRTTDSRHDFPRYPNLVEGEADPLVTGLPDPGRVRAAVARGVVNHGQRTMATALARWSSPRGALQPHTRRSAATSRWSLPGRGCSGRCRRGWLAYRSSGSPGH